MFVGCVTLISVLSASEVAIGAGRAEVLAILGEPRGEATAGPREILYYERGSVQLNHGIVTKVGIISEEQHARRLAETERLKAESEMRQARLTSEGEAQKARKLADQGFNSAPLSYQVAFWEDFARKYPGVPCAEQLALARLRLADDLERRQIEEGRAGRLAELEARLAAAEARAHEAETWVRPFGGYYSSYGRPRYSTSFGLWPVEYHFGDATTMVPPARSPGLMPDTASFRRAPTPVREDRDACDDRRGRHSGSHARPRIGSRI